MANVIMAHVFPAPPDAMGSPTLFTLSLELIDNILSRLDNMAILQLRLTSKSFSSLVSQRHQAGRHIDELIEEARDRQYTVLSIHHCMLSALPPSLFDLSHLTTLGASNNFIKSLPVEIRNLSSLKTLFLTNNSITDDGVGNGLSELQQLQKLYLGNNLLTRLPPQINTFSGLSILDLSGNQLTTLSRTIGNLRGLTRLYLNNNQLYYLPTTMCRLASLAILDVSDNQMSTLPEDIGSLPELTEISVFNNKLQFLPESLTSIRSLSFHHQSNPYLTVEEEDGFEQHDTPVSSPGKANMGEPSPHKEDSTCVADTSGDGDGGDGKGDSGLAVVGGNDVEDKPPNLEFNSLRELALRAVAANALISEDDILEVPELLQDIIDSAKKCSICSSVVFEEYLSKMCTWPIGRSAAKLPVRYIACCEVCLLKIPDKIAKAKAAFAEKFSTRKSNRS